MWPEDMPSILILCAGVVAALFTAAATLQALWQAIRPSSFEGKGRHVIITGGTSGLGLALAKDLCREGANVTVLGRNVARMENAVESVQEVVPAARIYGISCDVTDHNAMAAAAAESAEHWGTPCDTLICSAGQATPGYFEDQPTAVFKKQMEVNYFGCVNATHAVLPGMIEAGHGGHIVFVSSAAAFVGMIGYSQYCASKFAVRGFADSLRNEFVRYKINVHCFFPANIDTPGLEEEEKTKPAETREIEGTADTYPPTQASSCLLRGMRRGIYAITNDTMCEVLRMRTAGVTPFSNLALETVLAPILAIVAAGFVFYMDYVVLASARASAKGVTVQPRDPSHSKRD